MASRGSELSTRMSAEDENIENKSINDIALKYFKKYKVEISDAIRTTFPFLELLRDHEFITNEMYEDSQESFKKWCSVHLVIYNVLSELEKKFDMSLLGILFSRTIMRNYPDLLRIYRIFNKVIPKIEFLLESDREEIEERLNNQQSLEQGTVDLGNKSTLEKAEKKKRIRKHIDGTMDFDAEILPVICGEMVGLLIKRKFERGSTVKCIRSQDGNWFTLQEFELKGGVKNANWKTSVRCNGRTLKWLMEENFLPQPPRIYGKIKKLENAEKCKICWEEGKFIYCCVCLKGFHGDCHLPPVESQRAPWRCTFCTIEFSSRSQQQCYSESEVLARQMGPNDKSKCEFLLLKAYCHFETNVFPNIPHENYVQKASQCLETLRRLDEIKNSLKGGCYAQVEGFVLDMNNIYQDPKPSQGEFTHFLLRALQPQRALAGEIGRIRGPGRTQGRTMASGGSDLSTRVSAEDENIENKHINDIAFTYFKKYKVEISGAITTTFPFLELIRDRGFITNEMYEKSQESFKKRFSVHEVIYDILSELEKKFDMSVLRALFSKIIMDKYPDLFRIYKIFYKVIPDIKSFLESDREENEERLNNQLSLEQGTVDFGNNSISEKVKKRRRTKMHTDEIVDFEAEILPVTCGVMVGMLIKRKLKRGATVKCIRREDGNWFTPREFEVAGGYEKSSNWKNSVCCGGRTLKWMIQQGYLLKPPRGVKKKLKKAEKCKICGDEGKLFNCSWCFSFFHGDCHIPPVESKRNNWKCTFCKIKMSSRSQQQDSESEVLARPMRPEEKMKCEFLLLKAYCHFEGKVFPNIPHENYFQKASQCLETLRRLDEIKNSLNDGCYAQVEGFVLDMNNIYQDPKHNDSDLTEEEFKKNFKKVFAIQ
uniref:SP140 nuclear body protein like n=1 Tax=Myotis myotis TaxID=51298 RepID=A0A7J7WJF7_MYOMY|nr:SP140 nuclear body protein like [Myotis myotis]